MYFLTNRRYSVNSSLAACFSITVFGILVYNYKINLNARIKRVNEILSQLDMNNELIQITENYLRNSDEILQKIAQRQNIENIKCTSNNKFNTDSHNFNDIIEPSLEYELFRRRIKMNIHEMWNYLNFELIYIYKVAKNFSKVREQFEHVFELSIEFKRILLSDINKIPLVDGYEMWRQQESKNLSDLVQGRLHDLQNPADCSKAKKIICEFPYCHAGMGCNFHQYGFCFMVAYTLKRTLLYQQSEMSYNIAKELFIPISDTCTYYNESETEYWPGTSYSKLLYLSAYDIILSPNEKYFPFKIPEDLSTRLIKIHADPRIWWSSQILKYLFKPKDKEIAEKRMNQLNWKRPIVGVHIRRGDKIVESNYTNIETYMHFVKQYFMDLEINNTKIERCIFVATDDPLVIIEITKKYPNYTIIYDLDVAVAASVIDNRYKNTELNGIISDILLLSYSDYLVCAFTSNVCRLAYQLMQNYHPDASFLIQSVDINFYYAGFHQSLREVILPHQPYDSSEILIKPGDLILNYKNHWNSFSSGLNINTSKYGLFPTFKVKIKIDKYKFEF